VRSFTLLRGKLVASSII